MRPAAQAMQGKLRPGLKLTPWIGARTPSSALRVSGPSMGDSQHSRFNNEHSASNHEQPTLRGERPGGVYVPSADRYSATTRMNIG